MTLDKAKVYEQFLAPMLVGAKSVTRFETMTPETIDVLTYVVERMMAEEASPLEIAEAVAWVAASRILKSTELMVSVPNTPIVLEVFIEKGCPSPYDDQRHLFPIGLDERLLSLIPKEVTCCEGKSLLKRIAKVLHEEEVVMIENRFIKAPSQAGGTYYFEYQEKRRENR